MNTPDMSAGRWIAPLLVALTACSHQNPGGTEDRHLCGSSVSKGSDKFSVVLVALSPYPVVHLHVGEAFAAVARSGAVTKVTEPLEAPTSDVLCQATRAAAGSMRSVIFIARKSGRSFVSATITSVFGGVNHRAYGVVVIVG